MTNFWKSNFPSLASSEHVYLDSASTCQIPEVVINATCNYMREGHGNPGRGMHEFSDKAVALIEQCRHQVAQLLNASSQQIILTKSATESINFVASQFSQKLDKSHSIIVSELEHHANLLPWQKICQLTGAKLHLLKVTPNGELDLSNLENYLSDNCQLIAITQCSNVTGYQPDLKKLMKLAQKHQVPVLVDGAQAIPHQSIDIKALDCDYYVFSGHKLYAPGGVGILYCKNTSQLAPLLLGGGIVDKVTPYEYQLTSNIQKFEAGSPNMPAIVGLSAAITYINQVGFETIHNIEKQLVNDLTQQLINTELREYFSIISHPESRNIVSISSKQFHSHDIATILASQKIAVRAGHHCAQPLINALGLKHCVRVSLGLYNTHSDIQKLTSGLKKVTQILL